MAQSGQGKIVIREHFVGAEWPVALTVAAPVAFQGLKLVGDLAETDTGAVHVDKAGGWLRLSGNDEDGKGAALATGVCFSPLLNGTLIFETRLEMAALTARNVFAGFCGTIADDVAEPVRSATVTHTYVAAVVCGFVFDSQLTDATHWHMVAKGGTTSPVTVSTENDAALDTITAAVNQLLRVEIEANGTARWYIDNVLRQTVVGAVDPAVLLGALVGAWGTTTTAADVDVNYFYLDANNDWTV